MALRKQPSHTNPDPVARRIWQGGHQSAGLHITGMTRLRCFVDYPLGGEKATGVHLNRKPCRIATRVPVSISLVGLGPAALWVILWVGKGCGSTPRQRALQPYTAEWALLQSTACDFGHMLRLAIYCPVVCVFYENSCLTSVCPGLVEAGRERELLRLCVNTSDLPIRWHLAPTTMSGRLDFVDHDSRPYMI